MFSDSHASESSGSHASSATPRTCGSTSPPLRPQESAPPPILILFYTRRPIPTSDDQYTPPILRSLPRLALYENHINMMRVQLEHSFPDVPLAQIDVDLGFSFAALQHRLQSCFGHAVEEVQFEAATPRRCTWDGERGPVRDVIRVFKVLVR